MKYGTPSVPSPLDVSSIAQTPCEAVTDQQIESFPGTVSEAYSDKSTLTDKAKACFWNFDGERYSLGGFSGGVVSPSSQYHGLTTIYRAEQQGRVDTFRPVEAIAGYPAVIYASGRPIGDGFCRMAVGLRNDTAYRVNTELDPDHPANDRPCQVAKELAKFVVQNLKEGR